MVNDRLTLAVSIGVRLRRERLVRGWTLDRLSEAAGVSRRQVVNVEQGEANPSLGTLLALSDSLGISLSALVEPPTARLVKIHRAGEGAELWTGPHGGRGVLLVATQPPDMIEIWDWRMNPGERHESAPHHRGSRELLHVVAGVLMLDITGERFELGIGDSVTIPGDVIHVYFNSSPEPTHFSLTVYEPQPGSPQGGKDTHV